MLLCVKIVDIEVLELRVPGWDAQTFDGSWDDCVVKVYTDAGITGVAETDSMPAVVRAIVESPSSHVHARGLKEALVGRRLSDVAELWAHMYEATSYCGRRGVVMHAIGALDIAFWDIRGKALGRPVADLLGARRRDRVKAYGTVYPLGETPDEARSAIDRGLAMNLKAIKIVAERSWRENFATAEALIRTAREHVGAEIDLMIDAAAAWDVPEHGLPLMPVLRDCGFRWVEAPLPLDDVAGHARFQGYGVPIGGGDLGATSCAEFEQLFDAGAVDIAQPDPTMAGGLTGMLRIAEAAGRRGKRVVPHGYKSNLTIAANLAFLAGHEREEMLEYSTSRSPLRWELTEESLGIDADGMVAVPGAPGLGVTLDEAVLRKFRR
jgi:L-alanine-DL-glutamate epimerase-like enolase superfamily enzyme